VTEFEKYYQFVMKTSYEREIVMIVITS